jgi:hypothetical protein
MSNTNSTRDFYVYLHRKATTGEVFYVGKGVGRRAWEKRRAEYWLRTVKKHGLIVEILQDGLQEWYAHELERDLIALHGRRDLGYGPLVNLTDGGEGSSNPSASTISKAKSTWARLMSDPSILEERRKVLLENCRSQQAKANHAAAMARPEHKKKIGLTTKSMMTNPEVKEKHRVATAKATKTAMRRPDVRARHLEALRRNHENPEFQKNQAIQREQNARQVVCVESGQMFALARLAVVWLKASGFHLASLSKIYSVCNGKRKTAYGYHWRYADAVNA